MTLTRIGKTQLVLVIPAQMMPGSYPLTATADGVAYAPLSFTITAAQTAADPVGYVNMLVAGYVSHIQTVQQTWAARTDLAPVQAFSRGARSSLQHGPLRRCARGERETATTRRAQAPAEGRAEGRRCAPPPRKPPAWLRSSPRNIHRCGPSHACSGGRSTPRSVQLEPQRGSSRHFDRHPAAGAAVVRSLRSKRVCCRRMGGWSSGSFVGREDELATLECALVDVRRGDGRFVLVTGEPGIGKTTLVERFIAAAVAANVQVGVGRAWEGAGAPPWWIWREALRPLGVEIELPRTLANDEVRFACLEMVAESVRDVAASAPLILVLDDLQWADVSSLLAAKLLARTLVRMPLLLIGTLREPAPVREELGPALADLRREAIVVPLAPLTRADIATLGAERGLDGSAIDMTLSISGGNPLFATRLLDDADARRDLAKGREPPIPTGVMDVLVRHLNQLSDEERRLVDWAAVAGDPLDLPLVTTASGLSLDQARTAVDQARHAGIFTRSGPARFAHDLFRSATYGSIATARRAAMHLAIAHALGGRVDEEMRVADHAFLADPDGVTEEAIRAARAGATTAMARLAYEQAVVMAERVVLGEERAGRQAGLATALALLSEAKLLAGDADGSTAAAERALTVARTSDAAEPFAHAALALGLRRTMGMPNPALVEAIGEALTRMDASDTWNATENLALRCSLEARLGAALQPMVDPPRALASARAAIERARSSGDRALIARTIHEARPAFRQLEPFRERHVMDSELLSLATALGDANLAAHAHGRLFWLALEAGDAISADLHLAEYEGIATSLKVAQHEVGALSARAVRAGMCGDWDEANRALDVLDATRERWATSLASRMPIDSVILMRANLDALQGDPEWSEAAVRAAPPMLRPLLELLFDVRLGRFEKAAKSYAAVAGMYLHGEVGFVIRISLAEAAIGLRDATHAEQLSSLLEPWSGRHAVGTPLPSYEGSVDRLLAGLAALSGDTTRAERLYEAAIAAEEALGATPFAERTRRESHRLLATPATPAATRPPRARDELTLAHEGDVWLVRFGEEEARVKEAVGIQYVAYLVERPDVPVSAVELFALRALVRGDAPLPSMMRDAGERLDSSAVAAYRARARDLRLRLDEATSRNDAGAVEAATGELELIEDELRAAVGLGGRMRRVGSERERIRVNVTTRIRKAIERLRERAPHAAHHLATAIRTGTTCIYRRPPEK